MSPHFAVGGIAVDVYQIGKRGGDKSDNISYQFDTIVWHSLYLGAILIQASILKSLILKYYLLRSSVES